MRRFCLDYDNDPLEQSKLLDPGDGPIQLFDIS